MCAVFGFLDYKGKISNAVLKKLIHHPLGRCGSPWYRRNWHRLRPGREHHHLQKTETGSQGQAVLPQRHTSSHRTHPVHHPGQREAKLQQPPVRGILRHGSVRPRPQRCAVQRQGASPGTASPNDTNRNRQLRRRAAFGTGTEP